jgi:hypothetical protein
MMQIKVRATRGEWESLEVPPISLELYVTQSCLTCGRSLKLAEYIRQRFPSVDVRVVDVATEHGEHGDLVVATPTFILNGHLVSLGNPSQTELEAAVATLLSQEDGA